MTNEEAKKMLKAKLDCLTYETAGCNYDCNNHLCDGCALNYEQGNMGEQKQAIDMAIKALEQQSCEDCVSREDAIRIASINSMPVNECVRLIKELPSVTPKAEWIPVSERLPEEPGVYLVSMNRLGYPQREVDGFVCGRWERFGNDVIAWCEIPEPY